MNLEMMNLFCRMGEIAGADKDEALDEAIDGFYELLRERDMYRDRCLAAAKRMDEMALKLQGLEARRKKANEA